MGQHSNEFAPLKRQRFQVCDDARRQRGGEAHLRKETSLENSSH